jgi:hypothetical protein
MLYTAGAFREMLPKVRVIREEPFPEVGVVEK